MGCYPSVTWTVNPNAGGSLASNVYTTQTAGVCSLTATLGTLSNSVLITVTHASATTVAVNPYNENIMAGSTETYTETASDAFGNSWDVTSSASWSIDSGAGGSWSGNVYSSNTASRNLDSHLHSCQHIVNHASNRNPRITLQSGYFLKFTNHKRRHQPNIHSHSNRLKRKFMGRLQLRHMDH